MNIFDEVKPLSIANFYFKEEGDQVQGTYIGKRVGEKDNYGNEVTVYEIQTEDGIKNVPFTSTKKINEDMNHVHFGQIIGFKHEGMKTFTKNGKPTQFKDIRIFADPKIVDKAWMTIHADGSNDSGAGAVKEEGKKESLDELVDFMKDAGPSPYDKPSVTPESQLKTIAELAKTKLGVNDPLSIKEKVMESTALAFLPINYAKIIESLTNM